LHLPGKGVSDLIFMAKRIANRSGAFFGASMRRADMKPSSYNAYRPVSLHYLSRLSTDIGKVTLVVLITIETLFLSDVIVSRVLPELLAHGAGISTIALIVLYSAPSGLFIALPTALLIGVYIVILRRREDQEFKIFAGLGYSPGALSITALAIGLVGAAGSLVLSGFVEPTARFLLTSTLEGVAYEAIRDGELTSGRFYQIGDTTFYAASGRLNKVAGDVFLYQDKSDDGGRVIIASHLFNLHTNKQDQTGVLFDNVNIYEFRDQAGAQQSENPQETESGCVGCQPNGSPPPLKHLYFDKFYMELPKVNLAQARDWRSPEEANFVEMFLVPEWDAGYVQVFGERLLRAALCLVTPLMALVAVAFTYSRTLLLSLPTASAVVLVFSFFASNSVGLVSQYGTSAIAAGILGVAIAISGVCVFLVQTLNSNFIRSIGVSV
jgi:lipopolysaccharide export LptBFGC system permease protein LptF